MAFKIRQNPFSAGDPPRTPLHGVAHDAPSDPYSAREGILLPIPHSTRHRPTFGDRYMGITQFYLPPTQKGRYGSYMESAVD